MSGQWHYSQDGAQYGPVDESEIIRLIQDGELAPGTPVLKVGSMDWQPAHNHACFQVEIYPRKKRPSVQTATPTTSKPASGGVAQSPRQTTTQPAATSSPAVTTVVVKEKSVLPWVVVGVAVVVALYLYFKPAPSGEDFARAPQNTGAGGSPSVQPVVPVSPPITSTPQGPAGTVLWEFETDGRVRSSPAIGPNGTVYIGSHDHKVYALDGKSGVKRWEFVTGGRVSSSPAIGSDGTVYVGSYDKKVYALDGKSGAKKWEFVTGGRVSSSPAIGSDGTLYVGSWDNKLYAIKTESKGLAKSPWPMRGQNAGHTGRVMKK